MARGARILLVGGSLNQTRMMHKVGEVLARRHDCHYSPFFCDWPLAALQRAGLLDRTVLGGRFRSMTDDYLTRHGLPVDEGGRAGGYDLVVTCSDLIVPRSVRSAPFVLVQEGMTDPENIGYHLARRLGLPRWLGSTSTNGLSMAYSRFCVASDGYKRHFAAKGIPVDRMVVTGIPNFDNCVAYCDNDFPYRGYVLAATSDARETFKRDDRRAFIARVREIAGGRPIIFKLHPNENWKRAAFEISRWAPAALVCTDGVAEEMVANCQVLVTQYSTLVYVGLALGKECHSYFDIGALREMVPVQNGGTSAAQIARTCEEVLEESTAMRITA